MAASASTRPSSSSTSTLARAAPAGRWIAPTAARRRHRYGLITTKPERPDAWAAALTGGGERRAFRHVVHVQLDPEQLLGGGSIGQPQHDRMLPEQSRSLGLG